MNEKNQLGKRPRGALSEEQFAQASLDLIQRWRLTLSMGSSTAAAPVLAVAPALARLRNVGDARCANHGPALLGLQAAASQCIATGVCARAA